MSACAGLVFGIVWIVLWVVFWFWWLVMVTGLGWTGVCCGGFDCGDLIVFW